MLNKLNRNIKSSFWHSLIQVFLWLLVIFIYSSCVYTLEDVRKTEVSPQPTVSPPSIELDFEGDTLLILHPTVINYDLTSQNYKWVNVDVFYGEELIFTSEELEDSFTLGNKSMYEINKLKFQVITNSGTGSLADEVGAEAVLFEKEWIVTIDTAPAEPMKFTNIFNDNGVLRIEWEKYSRNNFKSYNIYLENDTYSYYSTCPRQYIITDINTTYLVDKIHVGGDLIIGNSIRTINSNYDYTEENYNDPLPDITFSAQGKHEVLLEWNPAQYDQNFGQYDLFIDIEDGYNSSTHLLQTNDINETSVTTNVIPKFGETYRVKLYVEPKEWGGAYCNSLYSSKYVHLGTDAAHFELPLFSRKIEPWYAISFDEDIIRWENGESKTLEVSDLNGTQGKSVGISPNGEHLYFCSDGGLFKVDPETMEINYYTTNLEHYLIKYYTNHMAISDNNKVMLSYKKDDGNRDIIIVNPTNGNVLDSIETGESFDLKRITTNRLGTALLYDNSTEGQYGVTIDGDKFINKDTPIFLEGKYVDFNPINDTEVIVVDSYKLIKYNSSNWQIINEIPISKNLWMISIDEVTGYIGGLDDNDTYYIFNPDDGNIVDSIACYINHQYGSEHYYLHNNKLMTSGMSIDLNQ